MYCWSANAHLVLLVLSAAVAFEGIHEGDAVPAFKLRSADGVPFESSTALNGGANILTFCRPGQDYSEQLLTDLQHVADSNRGVRIAAVFSGAVNAADVSALAKRLGLSFPVLLDPDRDLYGRFGVIVAPSTAFINDKGVMKFQCAGRQRDFPQVVQANVECLLGKITDEERNKRVTPQKVAPMETNRPGAHYRLGVQMLKAGNRDAAQKELAQAWEGEPKLVEAGVELGYLLLFDGKNEDASRLLSQVLDIAPDNVRAVGGKGLALLRTGKEADGIELLQRAIDKGVPEPLLFLEMGRWSEKKGDGDAAKGYFKKGLELALSPSTSDQ